MASAQQNDQRPNIILILVDDLGFSDIGPYGASDIHTPNLDRLASQGIRFRQFYNNSISAPTRASLITGQFSHKAGIGYFDVDLGLPPYQGYLNKESLTFGEVLQQAGYTTLISGKWHVGDKPDQLPNQRGFDHFYGFGRGGHDYYAAPKDQSIQSNGRGGGINYFRDSLYLDNKRVALQKDEYLTESITNHALDFIDEASKKDNPFFLYLAFNAPHWPLQSLPEDIEKYKGVYSEGWDVLRQKRFENAKKLGVIDGNTTITKHDERVREWASLPESEKKFYERRQEVFASMIDRVDQEIGKISEKLKEVGRYDNTLIIFLSDNGAQGGSDARTLEQNKSGEVGTAGSWHTQNSNWSQAGNSPWREYKNAPYEGGISAPFIAWYPGHIPAGKIVDGVGHIIDLAPTFYDLAKAKYPKTYKGHSTNALPGKSLTPVLFGKNDRVQRTSPLFWERAGNSAVRDGDWKLVYNYRTKTTELYNIKEDRSENNDVASSHKDIVERLQKEYDKWAKENGVENFDRFEDFFKKRNPYGNDKK
ncbi:MAG: arylsulfatase [Bacteroidaceae bacterium]|nr:arylsulfatase [Bacteroidaceae bacterium]